MRTIPLGTSGMEVPTIAVGCMRINSLNKNEAERFVQTALEAGATFFDHADVYGGGTCEEIFAEAIHMNDDIREKIILQSKCGIRPHVAFDFSGAYSDFCGRQPETSKNRLPGCAFASPP